MVILDLRKKVRHRDTLNEREWAKDKESNNIKVIILKARKVRVPPSQGRRDGSL